MENNLKIVHYIHGFTNGGAETVVKDYLLELKKRGYDVKVFVDYEHPDMITEKIVRNAGIEIISINGQYVRPSIIKRIWNKLRNKFFNSRRNEKFFRNFLLKNDVDVIHCHSNVKPFNKLTDILKEKRIKFFCTCHTDLERLISMEQSFYDSVVEFLSTYEINFIALHNDMAKDINEKFNLDNTIMLNNPIDINRFKNPTKTKTEMREELNIPEDAFVVGHVGRFHPVKNHKFLVDVFNEIKKIKENAFLLMVGSGELKQNIVQQLNDLGLKDYLILDNRGDVQDILQAMDTFVFPSIKEGLPLVLLEAQAAKLRIFSSASITNSVCVTDCISMLNLADSSKEWARKIVDEEFISEPVVGKLSDFDVVNVVDRLLEIYKRK